MATAAGSTQRALAGQIGEVAGGGRWRSAGDVAVIRGAESALEALRLRTEEAPERLFLARVQSSAEPVEQARLLDQSNQPPLGPALGLQHDVSEPRQPLGDVERPAGGGQSVVVGPAAAGDRSRQRDQAGFAERLGERLLRRAAQEPRPCRPGYARRKAKTAAGCMNVQTLRSGAPAARRPLGSSAGRVRAEQP